MGNNSPGSANDRFGPDGSKKEAPFLRRSNAHYRSVSTTLWLAGRYQRIHASGLVGLYWADI